MVLWKILLLNILVCCIFAEDNNEKKFKDVKTIQGLVRGYKSTFDSVYEFHGIPYATTPKGKDRYKAPLPAPVWLETLEAVDKNIVCPQHIEVFEGLSFNHVIEQDCLIANIFVPDVEETNLPVIVYVHGGGYVVGAGDFLKPTNFVKDRKVIVVTFNYRLGALGFLCLGTDNVPGNAGMKDQVALLRWVKQNIANFGGNPNDVTIAGYSAGAMSVDLLMLSKMADGLFTKVITESGSNLGSYSVHINPVEKAKEFAKRKGFDNIEDFYALENFYLNTPWEDLIEKLLLPANATSVFAPCVERNTAEEPFLVDSPYNIILKGDFKKVPLLYGLTDAEGLLEVPNFDEFSKIMNQDFASVLPGDLKFETEEQRSKVADMVKKFYFKDKDVSLDTIASYVNYFTDTYFAISLSRAVKLLIKSGHKEIFVYEYSFVFDDPRPLPGPSPQITQHLGADHCSQTIAIFDGLLFFSTDESKLSKNFVQMKAVIRELWYNFAVTKKPVPEGSSFPAWPPSGADCSPYMSLNETLKLRGPLHHERMAFWDQIYEKYYSIPLPPSPPVYHTEL